MIILTDIVQGSDDWINARLGLVTMSKVDLLLTNGKQEGGFGAAAMSYRDAIVSEIVTGIPADQFTGNRHTERGHELEPVVRQMYSDLYGVEVDEVGMILNHCVGYSPDGLVSNDGLIEIKTKLPKLMVSVICDGVVPTEHMPQCQGGLWVSEREWLDFIAYAEGMPLFVKRVYRDEDMIRKISERVSVFNELVRKRIDQVMSA